MDQPPASDVSQPRRRPASARNQVSPRQEQTQTSQQQHPSLQQPQVRTQSQRPPSQYPGPTLVEQSRMNQIQTQPPVGSQPAPVYYVVQPQYVNTYAYGDGGLLIGSWFRGSSRPNVSAFWVSFVLNGVFGPLGLAIALWMIGRPQRKALFFGGGFSAGFIGAACIGLGYLTGSGGTCYSGLPSNACASYDDACRAPYVIDCSITKRWFLIIGGSILGYAGLCFLAGLITWAFDRTALKRRPPTDQPNTPVQGLVQGPPMTMNYAAYPLYQQQQQQQQPYQQQQQHQQHQYQRPQYPYLHPSPQPVMPTPGQGSALSEPQTHNHNARSPSDTSSFLDTPMAVSQPAAAEPTVALTPSARPVLLWKKEDVEEWLNRVELGKLSETFRRNSIDGQALVQLTEGDLNNMGVLVGRARKFFGARGELVRGENTDEKEEERPEIEVVN
ncbi:hypothetical protein HKX48_004683 [Thoreauomyces humboldtii]|nr:hypothetical protein HKX48_004683 [Thoreauomyces humboldtii]